MKNWLKDKWNWLLTFNEPPRIKIKAENIIGPKAIIIYGRMIVDVEGKINGIDIQRNKI